MFYDPDPLLLEIFDAVQKQLARALEECGHRSSTTSDAVADPGRVVVLKRIAGLKNVLDELQIALDRRQSRLVH